MAYEERENSGALFVNDRKEKPTHPDFKGTCMVGGVKYRISAWEKAGKKGTFQSLAFTPVDDGGSAF